MKVWCSKTAVNRITSADIGLSLDKKNLNEVENGDFCTRNIIVRKLPQNVYTVPKYFVFLPTVNLLHNYVKVKLQEMKKTIVHIKQNCRERCLA